MAKRGFRRGTMNEKREKEAFVGVRQVKIGENKFIPREGKSKIDKNQLSLTRENKKSSKIAFPSRGKIKND